MHSQYGTSKQDSVVVAYEAHNLMVVGAIPTPAPKCNEAVPLSTMTSGVKLRDSNSPQFWYSSGGLFE